nr:hypothetical protein BDOA9_0124720 [Bradyrhizobium sp. DOA9]
MPCVSTSPASLNAHCALRYGSWLFCACHRWLVLRSAVSDAGRTTVYEKNKCRGRGRIDASGSACTRIKCMPALFRTLVNPSPRKYSPLPNFGNLVHLTPSRLILRGDRVVVLIASRACGGRGSVGRDGCGQGG